MRVLLIVVAMVALAGCGDDGDGEPAGTPTTPPTSTGTSAGGGTTVTIPGTPTAVPSMELAGKMYPIPVAQCMQKVWDDRVDRWNRGEGRDRFATSTAWFRSKGWPATFEATMKAPATYDGCKAAR